jgi:hypothetical protein
VLDNSLLVAACDVQEQRRVIDFDGHRCTEATAFRKTYLISTTSLDLTPQNDQTSTNENKQIRYQKLILIKHASKKIQDQRDMNINSL